MMSSNSPVHEAVSVPADCSVSTEQEREQPPLRPSVANFHRVGDISDEMLHELRKTSTNPAARRGARASTTINLTIAPASPSRQDGLVPRFVRATQILMLGAERRRAAEAQAEGKGVGQ